jgi:hypothetical protein
MFETNWHCLLQHTRQLQYLLVSNSTFVVFVGPSLVYQQIHMHYQLHPKKPDTCYHYESLAGLVRMTQ